MKLSNGAISNCMRAIAADIKGEEGSAPRAWCRRAATEAAPLPRPPAARAASEPVRRSRPYRCTYTPVPPAARAASEPVRRVRLAAGALRNRPDNVPSPARHGADTGEIPHDPWSQTDESRHRIGKKEVLARGTSHTTTVSMAENGRRETIYRHAAMAYRPMVHDGNTGGMRFRWWQPQEIHQSGEEKERRMAEWVRKVSPV